MLRGLIQLAENAKVDFLRIDPNVLRMERDIKGNPIEGGENHEDVTALLKSWALCIKATVTPITAAGSTLYVDHRSFPFA
ncbi:MAG: hypothetical protein ACLSA6_12965 [Holdemania massiliensis]